MSTPTYDKELDEILDILIDLCGGNIWWSYQSEEKNPAIGEAKAKIQALLNTAIKEAYNRGFESGVQTGHAAEAESRDRIEPLQVNPKSHTYLPEFKSTPAEEGDNKE